MGAVVAALALGTSAMEATNLAAFCERTADGVRCIRDGKVVWSFSTAKGKPCVHPLHLPDGTPLTASEDADHPWHRGLWFCWKFLNGVNYWETDANGLSKGEQRVVSAETECRGASAAVRLTLAWGPRSEPFVPVLDERRTIAFSAPQDDGSYEIVWRARFTARERVEIERTPPYHRKDGTWGGGYAGFSLRLEPGFAAAAKTTTSCGATGQVDVVAREEQWIDYSNDTHGGIRLEALKAPVRTTFYHWANRRFTNLSPIFSKPLTLERGETLELAYRVTVHPTRPTAQKDWFCRKAGKDGDLNTVPAASSLRGVVTAVPFAIATPLAVLPREAAAQRDAAGTVLASATQRDAAGTVLSSAARPSAVSLRSAVRDAAGTVLVGMTFTDRIRIS